MKQVILLILTLGLMACDYLPKSVELELNTKQKNTLESELSSLDSGVANALLTHQFVALGDAHYYPGFMQAITSAIVSDQVVAHNPHIVVEFGNKKYQSYIDDYVKGVPVDETQLQLVLRETVYFTAWLGQGYLEFFQAIRKRNLSLPEGKQLKVTLAEAYYDWHNANQENWQQAAKTKVDGFYDAVAPLIESNQKAILVFGGFHLLKPQQTAEVAPGDLSLIARIEQTKANSVFAIWPIIQPVLIDALPNIFEPKMLITNDSVLKDVEFANIMPKARVALSKIGSRNGTLSELTDALLYIGETQRDMRFSKAVSNDKAWKNEMKRRVAIIGGRLEQRFNTLLKSNQLE